MSDHAWTSLAWWGYVACAAIYVVGGLRADDPLSILGSLFFLVATLMFLVLHIRAAKTAPNEETSK